MLYEVITDLAEKLYIGKGKREKVEFVSKMLKYDQLTPTAKTELLHVIKEAVKAQEERFVEFLNNCGPITNRMHTLQLLPGVITSYSIHYTKLYEDRVYGLPLRKQGLNLQILSRQFLVFRSLKGT